MSSIPSIREGEGFISMEDVRLVTSFVKLMVKFCNEKRAAATAAKKCVIAWRMVSCSSRAS